MYETDNLFVPLINYYKLRKNFGYIKKVAKETELFVS